MTEIKNGTIRPPKEDVCEEYNWKTLTGIMGEESTFIFTTKLPGKSEDEIDTLIEEEQNKPFPLDTYYEYVAQNEIYVDGEWVMEAFKKEEDWEKERKFYLIKGKWYPAITEVEEIQYIMERIENEENSDIISA